jgi:hypothetical protein
VVDAVNTFLGGIDSACVIVWWIGLTAKGEEAHVHLPSLGPDAEEKVMQQLNSLNATLLKASRK